MNNEVKIGTWLIEGDGGRKAKVTGIVEIAGVKYAEYRFELGGRRVNRIRLDRINNGRKNSWRTAPETV